MASHWRLKDTLAKEIKRAEERGRCNLCREIMWPDLQALELGAIQSIAAV
jgi:hypothetical protein